MRCLLERKSLDFQPRSRIVPTTYHHIRGTCMFFSLHTNLPPALPYLGNPVGRSKVNSTQQWREGGMPSFLEAIIKSQSIPWLRLWLLLSPLPFQGYPKGPFCSCVSPLPTMNGVSLFILTHSHPTCTYHNPVSWTFPTKFTYLLSKLVAGKIGALFLIVCWKQR